MGVVGRRLTRLEDSGLIVGFVRLPVGPRRPPDLLVQLLPLCVPAVPPFCLNGMLALQPLNLFVAAW